MIQPSLPIGAVLLLVCSGVSVSDAGEPPFLFRDGDRIVIVGDSITVQGNYVRYVENFIRTRFPKWDIVVRNAGINGYRADLGFKVMDDDVLVWKPTVVVVNYGMNDGRRRGGVELYQEWIVPYVDKLMDYGTRVVLCSNSPLDYGDVGKYTGYNNYFVKMAAFAKQVAKDRGIPFVDQFNFLHPLWGRNWRSENPVPVTDHTRPQHSPDSVHARAPGQLNMTYIILKTLGAPREVSHAAIDVRTGTATCRRCEVRELKASSEGCAFVRTDEVSPCWVDDRGALGMKLVPFQDELNWMGLRVTGLPEGEYALKIDGQAHGQFTAAELKEGINLSGNRASPVYSPGRGAAELIVRKYVRTRLLRELYRYRPPEWLVIPGLGEQRRTAALPKLGEIHALDRKIAAAAQPRPHRYELTRVASEEAGR